MVPAPVLRHGTAHTVGQVAEHAVIQLVGGDVVHQGAVDKGIAGLLLGLGVELLTDGDEVRLLARQRALDLKEVGGRQVLILRIGHAPRQLNLPLPVAQVTGGQACGGVNQDDVLRHSRYALNQIGALGA